MQLAMRLLTDQRPLVFDGIIMIDLKLSTDVWVIRRRI